MIRIAAFAVLLATILVSGCTERERAGYSPIPQNSPPSWRMRPYGDMGN